MLFTAQTYNKILQNKNLQNRSFRIFFETDYKSALSSLWNCCYRVKPCYN